jgi:hypothetical protein
MTLVTVQIKGQNGKGKTVFTADHWDGLSAVSRTLALHDRLRDVTAGQPFTVLSATRRKR